MIIEEIQPEDIHDAVKYLCRKDRIAYPMAGGTVINKMALERDFSVVRLDHLNLNTIEVHGNYLEFGAMVTLQEVVDYLRASSEMFPKWLQHFAKFINEENTSDIRERGTIGGAIVTSDGTSRFVTALMAVDARLVVFTEESEHKLFLGDVVQLPKDNFESQIITKVILPLRLEFCFEERAHSPIGSVSVFMALASWRSGRMRIVLGGYGSAPSLVFDGNRDGGEVTAMRNTMIVLIDSLSDAITQLTKEELGMFADEMVKNCLEKASNY